MNRFTLSKLASAVTLCLASLGVQAQAQAGASGSTESVVCAVADDLTLAQRGIVKAAAQGNGSLRMYVRRTQLIYGLNTMEALGWLEAHPQARATCVVRVASAQVQ